MEVLIIGASGYVGSELYKDAVKRNIKVVGTKCHGDIEGLVPFDMAKDSILPIAEQFTTDNKYAIICSALANIDYCYQHKEEAYQVNVTATKQVMNDLTALGYRIVFFSTDMVFDGVDGNYTEESTPNPLNEYGKMKVEMEQYMLNHIPTGSVVRIGKAVGLANNSKDMFFQLKQQAKNNQPIYCIEHNTFSLSHIEDIVNCVFLILNRNMSGLYHIVGDEVHGRKAVVEQFLEFLQLSTNVSEKKLEEFPFHDKRPLRFSMSNEKFVGETGYEFTTINDLFKKYI